MPAALEAAALRVLAERFHAEATQAPLYSNYGDGTPQLFWMWATISGEQQVSEFVKRWLDQAAEEVDNFLDIWVGRAWGMESGLSHRADIRRDLYNQLARFIDPEIVLRKLRERHGLQIDQPRFHHDDGTPDAQRFAHQFACIHQAALKEQGSYAGTSDDATPPSESRS